MACAGFTGFTRGCCGTCTLLGVFLHFMLVLLLLLLASISIIFVHYICDSSFGFVFSLFAAYLICLYVHVAPAGAPA
jgi:hypothetical protein